MSATHCPCGGVLVDVPTCGKCGETWMDQPVLVLLDHAKRGTVPCATVISQRPRLFCALEVGHPPPCRKDRP